MSCKCIECPDCDGTGTAVFSLSGEYLGTRRGDDMCTLEDCEYCYGSGVAEQCDQCMDAEEQGYWEDEQMEYR